MGRKVVWLCHSSTQGLDPIYIQDMETFTVQTSVDEVPR